MMVKSSRWIPFVMYWNSIGTSCCVRCSVATEQRIEHVLRTIGAKGLDGRTCNFCEILRFSCTFALFARNSLALS